MHYTVYKTTNQMNGKFYVGVHKTSNPHDDYLGSGKLLKKAIAKYGVQAFKKEVLFVFDNAADAFKKESELVSDSLVVAEDCYNLKVGGFGGFDYLNRNGLNTLGVKSKDYIDIGLKISATKKRRVYVISDEVRKRISERQKGRPKPARRMKLQKRKMSDEHKKAISESLKGRVRGPWSEEARVRMSMNRKGRKHSDQTKLKLSSVIWITNGVKTKRHPKEFPLPEGWWQGRKSWKRDKT